MSIKLIPNRQGLDIIGTGYIQPFEVDLATQLESLRNGIQAQADKDLANQIELIRADFSEQFARSSAQNKVRLEEELEKIQGVYEQAANAMLETFRKNIEESISRLWREDERPNLIARLLRHLQESELIDKDGKFVISNQNYSATIEALESIVELDIEVLRRSLEGADYLPDHLLVLDSEQTSLLIDLDRVALDLASGKVVAQ
jgi:hypothetical protein